MLYQKIYVVYHLEAILHSQNRARTKKNEPMETGIKLTSSLIIDKSTNRIYESYRDYKRKDENEGYDWVGYPFTTFTFRK